MGEVVKFVTNWKFWFVVVLALVVGVLTNAVPPDAQYPTLLAGTSVVLMVITGLTAIDGSTAHGQLQEVIDIGQEIKNQLAVQAQPSTELHQEFAQLRTELAQLAAEVRTLNENLADRRTSGSTPTRPGFWSRRR